MTGLPYFNTNRYDIRLRTLSVWLMNSGTPATTIYLATHVFTFAKRVCVFRSSNTKTVHNSNKTCLEGGVLNAMTARLVVEHAMSSSLIFKTKHETDGGQKFGYYTAILSGKMTAV